MNDQAVDKYEIKLLFQPYRLESRQHVVEKSDTAGIKRRYLEGVSSGTKIDKHEERMTAKCIKSFMDQANSGDILLYPDNHGISASNDIGIMAAGKVMDDGDWWTQFRLYDDTDDIGDIKKEKINDIWKQVSGTKPYKQPRQKGFSIEGYIPGQAVLQAETDNFGKMKKRVIDDVSLDGVILVSRPAYASVANAVCKALGELTPTAEAWVKKEFLGELRKALSDGEIQNDYFRRRWDLNDALENAVDRAMKGKFADKRGQLDIIFREFGGIMTDLILKSEGLFRTEGTLNGSNMMNPYGANDLASKADVFRALLTELEKLSNIFGG